MSPQYLKPWLRMRNNMTDNEKIVDADVVKSTSVNESKEESKTVKTRQKKPNNRALWLSLLLVLAVSAGGIANVYKKLKIVENKLNATATAKVLPDENLTDIDKLIAKIGKIEKQTGEFAATQKILVSIPQSVNEEIRKLSMLEGKFSSLAKEVQAISNTAKAGLQNPALLNARPVIEDGIRAAEISLDLKQAALYFQDAAVILHNAPDPQNTLAEEKLTQLSKDLQAAYMPDTTQINKKINILIGQVNTLAFIGDKNLESKMGDAKTSADKGTKKFAANDLASSVWSDFKSLVKVSKDETEFVTVVANEARQAYRATLSLKLEQAKLLALRAEQIEYETSIQSSIKLAGKIFDKQNPLVIDFMESLAKLSQIQVASAVMTEKLSIAREIIK